MARTKQTARKSWGGMKPRPEPVRQYNAYDDDDDEEDEDDEDDGDDGDAISSSSSSASSAASRLLRPTLGASSTIDTLNKALMSARSKSLSSISCGGRVVECDCHTGLDGVERPKVLLDILSPDSDAATGKVHVIHTIPLPVREEDVQSIEALTSSCSDAPFGVSRPRVADSSDYAAGDDKDLSRIGETKYDKQVRDALELDAKRFRVRWIPCSRCVAEGAYPLGDSDLFSGLVQRLARRAATSLGVSGSRPVSAVPYKLLFYPPGGHFDVHRDTEKELRMFGTLVVQLPSLHEGGELTVYGTRWHSKGRNLEEQGPFEVHKFGGSQASVDMFFSAHYADARHALSPITRGYRTAVVYSLVWGDLNDEEDSSDGESEDSGSEIDPENSTQTMFEVGEAMKNWDLGTQPLLLRLEEHRYTEREAEDIGISMLKGRDHVLAKLLQVANARAGFPLRICLCVAKLDVIYAGEGSRGYGGYGDFGGGYSDSDDYDWSKVDSSLSFGPFFDESGSPFFSPFRIDGRVRHLLDDTDFSETNSDFWGDPDDEDFEGYSGNAGPEKTTHYVRVMLCLWPHSVERELSLTIRTPDLLAQAMSTALKARQLLSVRQIMQAAIQGPPSTSGYHRGVIRFEPEASKTVLRGLRLLDDSYITESVITHVPQFIETIVNHKSHGTAPLLSRFVSLMLSLDLNVSRRAAMAFAWERTRLIRETEATNCFDLGCLPIEILSRVAQMLLISDRCRAVIPIAVDAMLKKSNNLFETSWDIMSVLEPHRKAHNRFAELLGMSCYLQTMARCVPYFANPARVNMELSCAARLCLAMNDSDLWSHMCDLIVNRFPSNVLGDESKRAGDEGMVAQTIALASEPSSFSLLGPAAVRVAQTRHRLLSTETRPEQSGWLMPKAEVPGHDRVTAFLRGPDQTMVYGGGFDGIAHARNWASKHGGNHGTYSMTAVPSGIGKRAQVTLTKTEAWLKVLRSRFAAVQREAKALAKFLEQHGVTVAPAKKKPTASAAKKPTASAAKKNLSASTAKENPAESPTSMSKKKGSLARFASASTTSTGEPVSLVPTPHPTQVPPDSTTPTEDSVRLLHNLHQLQMQAVDVDLTHSRPPARSFAPGTFINLVDSEEEGNDGAAPFKRQRVE